MSKASVHTRPHTSYLTQLGANIYLSSQVEFVEEVQSGELYVSDYDTPYDNGDGLWNVSRSTSIRDLCLIFL